MITKNAATLAILTEALNSLAVRAKKNKLQDGDTKLLESIWRCSFTSHTKYDREAVGEFAKIINYGGTPPTKPENDDQEQYDYVVSNAHKWIAKWDICPKITAKLEEEAAKKKAEEQAAKEAEKAAKEAEAAAQKDESSEEKSA